MLVTAQRKRQRDRWLTTSTEPSARARDERTHLHFAECREALTRAGALVGEERLTQGSAAEALLHSAEALDSSLIVIGAGDRAQGEPGTGATALT